MQIFFTEIAFSRVLLGFRKKIVVALDLRGRLLTSPALNME